MRPEVIAVRSVDELGSDADASPGSPYAAFENGGDAQRRRDVANVLGLAFEGERGSARGHLQFGNLRQEIDNLLGQPVAEVFILLVPAHIGEWQHRDGGLLLL